MKDKNKIETQDYYTCARCEINTLESKGRMIPCPRGGCEAKLSGTITTVVTVDMNLTPEQIQWNKENYR